MDYEKKYKEANNKVAARFGTNVAKEIFTDLYESEDEKIRKELITHCRNTRCVTEEGAERIAKWIAWLEKQGEQKLADKVEPKFKVGDIIEKKHNSDINRFGQFTITDIKDKKYWYNDRIICDISEQYKWELVKQKPISFDTSTPVSYDDILFGAKDYELHEATYFIPEGFHAEIEGDKVIIKRGKQKPFELPKGEDYGIDGLWHAISILQRTLGEVEGYQSDDGILEHQCAITAVKKLYNQKPAWDEKDESHLIHCVRLINNAEGCSISEQENAIDWLKSLKQRIGG